MSTWDPQLYLRYGDERTRAARDLLAQVPVGDARLVYDLGCGPGNSTELLMRRFPGAEIVGIDSSEEMLARARASLPGVDFQTADLQQWRPERPADLLFANAVFQWIPGHLDVFETLLKALPSGGVLAVQMPDNLGEPAKILMRTVAENGPWAESSPVSARPASFCLRRRSITTGCGRCAGASTFGIRFIITFWRLRPRSSNG